MAEEIRLNHEVITMGGIVVRLANFLGVEVPLVLEAKAEGQALSDIGNFNNDSAVKTMLQREQKGKVMLHRGS